MDFIGSGLCSNGVFSVVYEANFDAASWDNSPKGNYPYGHCGNGRFAAHCFPYPIAICPIARTITDKNGRAYPQPATAAIAHAHSDTNGGATDYYAIPQPIAYLITRNVCGSATR